MGGRLQPASVLTCHSRVFADVSRALEQKVQLLLDHIHRRQHSQPAQPQEHDQMVTLIPALLLSSAQIFTVHNVFCSPASHSSLFCACFHFLSLSTSRMPDLAPNNVIKAELFMFPFSRFQCCFGHILPH